MIYQNIRNKYEYSIIHLFQPIYNLKNNDIIGYEALLRDSSGRWASPVEIFKDAEKKGCRNSLDLMSIKTAFKTFKDESRHLFVNIFPSTLLEADFLPWWDTNVPPAVPIVMELSENEPVEDWDGLKAATCKLQARGVKIAIDDMGAGYSSFRQWIELEPDFIKLDRYFAEGLSASPRKQKAVRTMVELLSDTAEIIIEGVETEADLGIIKLLEIPYAQGFLLGRPAAWEARRRSCF